MNDTFDLNSILDAIKDINTKPKKKLIFLNTKGPEKIINNIISSEEVLPITEKIILEAEQHINKIKDNRSISPPLKENILILDNEYNEPNIEVVNLEKIKQNIINDLYTPLSGKIKKNTLKIIFELREKINNLELKIKILNSNNTNEKYSFPDINTSHNQSEEHLINEDNLIEKEEHLIIDNNSELSDSVIKTLRLQESYIKNFEKNEEKLRLKIVDLEQDISLLKN